MSKNKSLTSDETSHLLITLKSRFEKNVHRHKGIEWSLVESKLRSQNAKLWSLYEMERTGGEPDVVFPFSSKQETHASGYIFVDCSAESPTGRRSLCYDHEAWESRKEHKPEHNVIDLISTMGIELLNEELYRELHTFGMFDSKTSSWILTPSDIRKLGGALFADYRYGHVFIYHNGAQSYYNARGFRGMLQI